MRGKRELQLINEREGVIREELTRYVKLIIFIQLRLCWTHFWISAYIFDSAPYKGNQARPQRLWSRYILSTENIASLSPSLPHTPHTGEQVIIFTLSAAHTHVSQFIQPIFDPKVMSNNIINKDLMTFTTETPTLWHSWLLQCMWCKQEHQHSTASLHSMETLVKPRQQSETSSDLPQSSHTEHCCEK